MIEILESRIAPAVILSLTLGKTGALLTEETANPGDNSVSITMDSSGALHVDPSDANTQIRFNGTLLPVGDQAVAPGFIGAFTAKLGAGNDQITISGFLPGATTVDLGIGSNALTLDAATLGAKLTVKGGTGADTVTFSGATTRVFGGVNIALGEGTNLLNNTTTALLHVGGDFIATSGKGADDFLMAGKDVQILGKLGLTTGTGDDEAGFVVTGRLDVGGAATLKSGGLAGNRTDQKLNGANVFIGGAVLMDIKTGRPDQVILSAGTIFIGGAAKFTSGGTDNFGSVELGAPTMGSPTTLHIGGSLSATTKSLDSEFDILDVTFGSIVGGLNVNGFTSVAAELSGSIGGAVKVALAGAELSGYFFLGTVLNAADPLHVGAVTVTTKNADSTLSLLKVIAQGTVKITGTKGGDYFGADDTLFLAAATIDLGAGADQFGIESGTNPTGLTQVNAPLTLLGGGGVDTFDLSGAVANTTLNAIATILIDGGAETDVLHLGATGNYQTKVVQKNI